MFSYKRGSRGGVWDVEGWFNPVMLVLFLADQILCLAAAFITCGVAYKKFHVSEKDDEYMNYTVSF